MQVFRSDALSFKAVLPSGSRISPVGFAQYPPATSAPLGDVDHSVEMGLSQCFDALLRGDQNSYVLAVWPTYFCSRPAVGHRGSVQAGERGHGTEQRARPVCEH
jgi:hypothetical protein